MKMTGQERIAAPRQQVWDALNDPDVLRQCIPGCQSLEREPDGRLKAVAQIKIGPIGARFSGVVTLSDLDPPNGYRITGSGNGGISGSAQGGATVRLSDDGAGTLLAYEVDAQVGGRLAQLGGPIIDATAKRMAGQFFGKFGEIVAGTPAASVAQPATAAAPTPAAAPASHVAPTPAGSGGSAIAWVLALIVAGLVGFLIGRNQGTAPSDWAGIAIGLIIVLVAGAAFAFGRRSAAPVVVLDANLLAQLTGQRR